MSGQGDHVPRTTPKNGVLEQILGFIKYMMNGKRTTLERIAGFLALLAFIVLVLAVVGGVVVAIILMPKGLNTWLGIGVLSTACGGALLVKKRRRRP